MTDPAAAYPLPEAGLARPHRDPAHEVRVRLPRPLLSAIDALLGERYADRSEAIRALLFQALKEPR